MPGQLEEVLRALPADTKLVLATGYGPRTLTWIDSSNNLIREFAQKKFFPRLYCRLERCNNAGGAERSKPDDFGRRASGG